MVRFAVTVAVVVAFVAVLLSESNAQVCELAASLKRILYASSAASSSSTYINAPQAPTTPDQVPTELVDLYNFLVQTGGELIIKLGAILSNYLDTALVLSIQSISKREAEAPFDLMMALSGGNMTSGKVVQEEGELQYINNPHAVSKLKAFQVEMAAIEMELETIISETHMLQYLGALHAAKQGITTEEMFARLQKQHEEHPSVQGESVHARKRRQTTLGAMPYAYIIATSLQTLFSYLKQSLGQFTYLSSQLLNLYQILPVQPNVSTG